MKNSFIYRNIVRAGLRVPIFTVMFFTATVSLGFLATPIALGSWWGMPVALALFAVVVARLLDEERFLSANLPGYDAYCRRVRYRLVPLVW